MKGAGAGHRLPVVPERGPGEGESARDRNPAEGEPVQAWSVDLNRYRVTRFILTNRAVRPSVQVLMVGLFGLALYHTFAGPQDPTSNFGAIAFFGLWWAPVMLLSLLLMGRVWCYFCPIGAITQFLQRFGLGRRFPTFRDRKWPIFGLGLSVVSIAGLSFVLARLPLYKFGVAHTPWAMGVYFLVFLAVAVALALVFRQRAFCRYVCPATAVMSVTARLSPLELRQDRESRVPDCMTAEFKSNYLSTERRCVACMHCAEGQPGNPVRLRLRWPGAAAVRQRILLPDEAWVALVIWAVFPIDHVLGSQVLAELPALRALPGLLAGTLPYLASIAATIAVFSLVNRLAARWSGVSPSRAFARFAFAYVPLGIMFQLGRHTIPGIMQDGGALVNGFAAGFAVPLDLPASWADPETVDTWSRFAATVWPWLAVLWGALIAWFIAREMTTSRQAAAKAFVPHLLLMSASTALVMGILG